MRYCIVLLLCLASFHSGYGTTLYDGYKWLWNGRADIFQNPEKYAPCASPLPDAMTIREIKPIITVYTKTKKNPYHVEIADQVDITEGAAILAKEGYFAVDRQVVFIVHGYMNSKYPPKIESLLWFGVSMVFPNILVTWMDEIKDAILKKEEDSTVIRVSWGNGAILLDYNLAAANTKTVASLVSSFAESILNTDIFKGNPNNTYLYCIGHSLGAQICGQAGRMSGHFDRVTGLDPAGPGFDTCWNTIHVDKDSAKCVDNIHTDGTDDGNLKIIPGVYHFGTMQQWGHVDFYPNKGTLQPGCTSGVMCNHNAAIEFFKLSINPKNKCTADCDGSVGKQSMGYYSSCHRNHMEKKEGYCRLNTKRIVASQGWFGSKEYEARCLD